jgi:hypothetical protein
LAISGLDPLAEAASAAPMVPRAAACRSLSACRQPQPNRNCQKTPQNRQTLASLPHWQPALDAVPTHTTSRKSGNAQDCSRKAWQWLSRTSVVAAFALAESHRLRGRSSQRRDIGVPSGCLAINAAYFARREWAVGKATAPSSHAIPFAPCLRPARWKTPGHAGIASDVPQAAC